MELESPLKIQGFGVYSMNKTVGVKGRRSELGQMAQCYLAAAQHLLSPFSSTFLKNSTETRQKTESKYVEWPEIRVAYRDPDPHGSTRTLDPDPHESQNSGAYRLKIEPGKAVNAHKGRVETQNEALEGL